MVAAQITGGAALGSDLFAREVADTTGDRNASIGLGGAAALRLVGALARRPAARPGLAGPRRAQGAHGAGVRAACGHRARVARDDWPATRLRIPAVEAETGEVTVFDSASGVSLIDAVAASCAVPLVWPPMTERDRRYIDGGVRSVANVDLARGLRAGGGDRARSPRGAARGPAGGAGGGAGPGVRTAVVSPSDAALTAIGRNPLDPTAAPPPPRRAGSRRPRWSSGSAAAWG